MAKTKSKTKKELLTEQIADAVRAGREVAAETVDFSDPNRPKTCLEVDFPIIPINQIAAIEGNAGKPIYQMSKWWARRRSSVFRSMLVAAAMKAPDDDSKAAKAVWDVYYANHQKRGSLRHLKVADPFMGGGTTIVEGSRLGMQMFGWDLNPVAWFVVKNEMAQVNIEEVKRLLADIEAEVKPIIMPYYACDGPNGEKGKWFRRNGTKKRDKTPVQSDFLDADKAIPPATEDDWEELSPDFDIFALPWHERKHYRYEGPEIIYTFWAKHGPCQREGCGHRTPIMSTPVVAIKTLTVDAWPNRECPDCRQTFDVERHAARMAPDSPLFVAPDEKPFAVMDAEGRFTCPHCGKVTQDERALADNSSSELGKAQKKKVELTLLVHPQWLEGCAKHDEQGREYGGSSTDSVEATVRWNNARAAKLRLLEVRGLVAVEKVNKKGERMTVMVVPPEVTCPETAVTFYTDERGGTLAKKSTFACAADGTPNDVLESINASGKTGPIGAYAIQAYSSQRDEEGFPYGGRFFASANLAERLNHACKEWEERRGADLSGYWPTDEVMGGLETSVRTPLHKYHYHRWSEFFTPLQLLVHAQLLRAICENRSASESTKLLVLGGFQQYLRNNNLFSIWNWQRDTPEPFLSKNNMQPPARPIENCVFHRFGRGNWLSCVEGILETLKWKAEPWEVMVNSDQTRSAGDNSQAAKSHKVLTGDSPASPASLTCGSATDIQALRSNSCDLVITDPPFGDIMQYAELSAFFYVWLRLALAKSYPEQFGPPTPPLLMEAVENSQRHGKDSASFYQRALTESWKESFRVMKPGGILAFTFYHDKDEPWFAVLESLFRAGFYLEAAYPIRSDETKGEGGNPGTFGAQKVEYDIIHVCRKQMTEPQPISWARLRRQIVDDVRDLKRLLEQHRTDGLPAADLDVIRRGKALEHFSRHYGKVYIEQGREFGIREALPAIKQIVDEESDSLGGTESLPATAEPYTRQFFRLFYGTTQVPRDQMQKFLRGTGIAPSDFEERGWCSEKNKVFTLTPPIEFARAWKGASRKGMARDFDQTIFLVGGCVEGSNIRVMDTLDSPNFAPHPATAELVDWLTRHGGSQEIRFAAQRA
jgi:putative DNA methylase